MPTNLNAAMKPMSIPSKTLISVLVLMFLPTFGDVTAGTARLNYHEQALIANGTKYSLRIPVGYTLELLTEVLDSPRMLTFSEN